jgi:lysophospholipase L1-like esterase
VSRAAAGLITAAAIALMPLAARAADMKLCVAPAGTTAIVQPLEKFAAGINKRSPVTIVAIGSSSTSGTGASSPDMNYPSQLQVELDRRFPRHDIRVVNAGKGGEDAPEEVARLGRDAVALKPDLVIWQVGTNALLRRDDLTVDGERMREGVALMKRAGIDVVLMDLQYAPRVVERPAYQAMEDLIAETANAAHVGLFRRFAMMRYWQGNHAADDPAMIGADGLHMTDAGYGCLAADLAAALEANWRADTKLAQRSRAAAGAVAGLPASSAVPAAPGDVRRKDATPLN